MPHVTRLLVYPIKACQGVSVDALVLGVTGANLDRAWCVVDEFGDRFHKLEALSQRRASALAAVSVAICGDHLEINAKSMPTLHVPIDEKAYG